MIMMISHFSLSLCLPASLRSAGPGHACRLELDCLSPRAHTVWNSEMRGVRDRGQSAGTDGEGPGKGGGEEDEGKDN